MKRHTQLTQAQRYRISIRIVALRSLIRRKRFADGRNHINGIENFWNQAKRTLRKYNGIDRKSFPLFLKECEFRFNYGTPSQQLKILRTWCGI